jgi:hypothetical protein
MKCDSCGSEATIHITEIRRGISSDRHLCEKCADTLLPLEESDYSDYLNALPPRHSTQTSDEGEPTREEIEMTGVRQQVVVVDLRTGELQRVGLARGDSFSPVWSPDSSRLAMCHTFESLPSLVLVEPGKPWARRFLHAAFFEPASWSPDSRGIAFSHAAREGMSVWVADAVEGRARRLHSPEGLQESRPAWSPRDDRIAFMSLAMERQDPDTSWCSLVTTTAQGAERRRLITRRREMVANLSWSPDAQFIAAVTSRFTRAEVTRTFGERRNDALHVMDSASQDATDTEVPGGAVSCAWVARSPDEPAPAVLAWRVVDGTSSSEIVLVEPRSRRVRTIAADMLFGSLDERANHVSPDGRTLVGRRPRESRRIVLVDLATGATRELDAGGDAAGLSWHPERLELAALIRTDADERLEWISPDGERRHVVSFPRKDFFEATGLALSPDGNLAAVELHAARK